MKIYKVTTLTKKFYTKLNREILITKLVDLFTVELGCKCHESRDCEKCNHIIECMCNKGTCQDCFKTKLNLKITELELHTGLPKPPKLDPFDLKLIEQQLKELG